LDTSAEGKGETGDLTVISEANKPASSPGAERTPLLESDAASRNDRRPSSLEDASPEDMYEEDY